MSHREIEFDMARQPDDSTCGPTCLHSVYQYFRDPMPLQQVIDEVQPLEHGGTLGVLLGCHALRRGYRAVLYTYNLTVFDPSWFELERSAIAQRLRAQSAHKQDEKLRLASAAYLDFLERGGNLRCADLSPRLLRRLLELDRPVLVGLSATYLYREPRELPNGQADDVRGEPAGHFVVLCGYDTRSGRVLVADPLHPTRLSQTHRYAMDVDRLITAILLGVLTYDANLLVLEPARRSR